MSVELLLFFSLLCPWRACLAGLSLGANTRRTIIQKYCLLRANSVETLIYHYTPLEFCATGEKMAHEVGDPAGVWIDRAVARCMAAECEAYDPDAARGTLDPSGSPFLSLPTVISGTFRGDGHG